MMRRGVLMAVSRRELLDARRSSSFHQVRLLTDSVATGGVAGNPAGILNKPENAAVSRGGYWLRLIGFSAMFSAGALGVAMVAWPFFDAWFLPQCYRWVFEESGAYRLPPAMMALERDAVEEVAELLTGFIQPTVASMGGGKMMQSLDCDAALTKLDGSSKEQQYQEKTLVYGDRQGQVILVSGAPGSGKTSLPGAVWKLFEERAIAAENEKLDENTVVTESRALTESPSGTTTPPSTVPVLQAKQQTTGFTKEMKAREHRDSIPPVLYINCRAYSDPATILYGTKVHIFSQLGPIGSVVIAYEKMFNALVDFFTMGQQHAHVSHILLAQSIGHIRMSLYEMERQRKPGQPQAVVILDGVEQLIQLSEDHSRNSEASVCARNMVEMFIRTSLDDRWCNTILLLDSKGLDTGVRTGTDKKRDDGGLPQTSTTPSILASTPLGREFPEVVERSHLRYLPFRPSPPAASVAESDFVTKSAPGILISKGHKFDKSLVRSLLSEEGVCPMIINSMMKDLRKNGQIEIPALVAKLSCYPSDATDSAQRLESIGVLWPVIGTRLGTQNFASQERTRLAKYIKISDEVRERLEEQQIVDRTSWFSSTKRTALIAKYKQELQALSLSEEATRRLNFGEGREIISNHRPALSYVGPSVDWTTEDESKTSVDVHIDLGGYIHSTGGPSLFRSIPLSVIQGVEKDEGDGSSSLRRYFWSRGYAWSVPMLATDRHEGPAGRSFTTGNVAGGTSNCRSSSGGGVVLDRKDVISCMRNGDVLFGYSPYSFQAVYYLTFPFHWMAALW